MDKVKVAIRVRPINRREKELETLSIVNVKENQCSICQPFDEDKINRRKHEKSFAFDYCFDAESQNRQQEDIFKSLGKDILQNAFEGYNACIFAYGQTGSGKSYTMMGSAEKRGLIPRLCDALFERIASNCDDSTTHKVEVSYMEIYNEKVYDLLDPRGCRQTLKVREHTSLGPYVDGLSQLAVSSYEEIEELIEQGNKARTVAATNMNNESSRSHAVFSVILTQTLVDSLSGVAGEKMSRMSLIDLAGSERAVKTGAVGDRLKEGSNINKSLTTLGLVISKLADQSVGKGKNKDNFVPYRDSVLTWLLKDNLGGNSRTVMVATISPSSDNYEETLSTLRYADRAKRIVNHAIVNEDPKAKIIRELRQEVELLKQQLNYNLGDIKTGGQGDGEESLNEKLHHSEKLITNLSETWENKLKKTERMHHERQQALEKMGISVEASGISVQKNKYYLVNLNADPSLNEMLVYYLKDTTYVGRPDVKNRPIDIPLSGVGIEPHHCTLHVKNNIGLFLEPMKNARTCVNGSQINETIQLRHGDRILWGFNYFYRVNCPKSCNNNNIVCQMENSVETPAQALDYNFAREELMLNELSDDPIQNAIQNLEKQHETDKQLALDKQRREYERQFEQLRHILSPNTPSYNNYNNYNNNNYNNNNDESNNNQRMVVCTPNSQMKMERWAREREEVFKRGLQILRQDIMKSKNLVQEANFLSEEMGKNTTFQVTLQIPPQNLSPNRKKSSFVSEPAILVKRKGRPSQVWSMEKLEHKLIIMREIFNDNYQTNILDDNFDPFYENEQTHDLIGVANIFLECLFHDVKLSYQVPIISQQGEVTGRLQVEIWRTKGQFPAERFADTLSDCSSDSGAGGDIEDENGTSSVTCKLCIKQATGLPPSLSNYVFCQYQFFGQLDSQIVGPISTDDQDLDQDQNETTVYFDHEYEYTIPISEDFIEHCGDGALSIEVWGNRNTGFGLPRPLLHVDQQLAKARSLADRWRELTRKMEFWVEIQELNEHGEYVSVEVTPRRDCLTGGVYQLRQGQQRRVVCRVKSVTNSGTLPLICEAITDISIGSICGRLQCQRQLDSYTEEDLTLLREKWSDALHRRRTYLEQQIQKLVNKNEKTDRECEREHSLVDQWVSLTEERNAVLVPAPGSNIPGAPADWAPPIGLETHIPVIFLDLNADDFSVQSNPMTNSFLCGQQNAAGTNAIIPKENCNKFVQLKMVKHFEKEICAIAAWDSSVHDNVHLNRITQSDERVYLVIKCTVRLSHPAPMDMVLRKRVCVNVYKRQSLKNKLVRSFMGFSNNIYQSGIIYEIVSNIPKASEELENRESLAKMAANFDDFKEYGDGETYIEKYTKGITFVDSILMLDRLRQNVAVKELLQNKTRAHNSKALMRKTVSVPNFQQAFGSFDLSASEKSKAMPRSGSVMELCGQDSKAKHRFQLQGPNSASPNSCVRMTPRMSTLHEEFCASEQLKVYREEDESEENLFCDEKYDSQSHRYNTDRYNSGHRLTASRTFDSLHDVNCFKVATPSTVSSGYGSGAVSSATLSEDSISLKSASTDHTPENECTAFDNEVAVTSSCESDSSSDARTVVCTKNDATLHISEEESTMSDFTPPTHRKNEPDGLLCRNTNNNNNLHLMTSSLTKNYSCDEKNSAVLRKNSKKSGANKNYRKSLPPMMTRSLNLASEQEMEVDDLNPSFGEKFGHDVIAESVPDWCVVGENILIRPYNYAGIIAYVGPTEFAPGSWVGVELELPNGKNNGRVNGVRYFSCADKCGIFVRPDKIIFDRRGRRSNRNGPASHMKRSRSNAERLSDSTALKSTQKNDLGFIRRSQSRADFLSNNVSIASTKPSSRRHK